MGDGHLTHELEHLGARHVHAEEVTALLTRGGPAVEGVTSGAVLAEQRRAV